MRAQILPDLYGENCKGSIGYWANEGQVHDQSYQPVPYVRYYSQGGYPQVYLQEKSTFSLVIKEPTLPPSDQAFSHRIDVKPYQCTNVDPNGNVEKTYYQNFYLPWTAPNGATEVYGYDRVIYEDIYPEIDMLFYSGSAGQKLAFYCWPGSDPTKLALQFFGQDSLKVQDNGELKVWLSGRWVELQEAAAYQIGPNEEVIPLNWAATYNEMNDQDVVNFLFDEYDPELPIVLQIGALPLGINTETPGLCWSTLFGGSGYDEIHASTTDANGNYYVTGSTASDFMSFQDNVGTDLVGLPDAVLLAKFRPDYSLNWMAFYGGTTIPNGIVADQGGQAIITRQSGGQTQIFIGGHTEANDLYPSPLAGAYNVPTGTGMEYKGFIARFRDNGVLQWSTYFGSDGNELVHGLDVDAQGRLHLVGTCNSTYPQQFLAGASNGMSTGGAADIMLARFNANCALEWCAAIGGSSVDQGADIECHANGFYVSGSTVSNDFPVIGGGANYVGNRDLVLLDFNSQAALIWSSHHGGSNLDRPGRNGLTKDAANNLVVVGETQSSDMNTLSAGWFYNSANTGTAGFIARYASGSHTLTWSTYVSGTGITVLESASHTSGKLTVTGSTSDSAFPIVPNAAYYNQGAINSINDGIVMIFNGTTELSYSTFFGGEEGASGDCIYTSAYSSGSLFLGGRTSKPPFNPNAIFPLDDAGGPPAYFDESYDPALLNYSDFFLAAICLELNVRVPDEASTVIADFTLHPTADGQWSLLGLQSGIHHIDLYDSKGALVHQAITNVDALGKGMLQLTDPAPGIYICKATGQGGPRAAKLIIH